MGRFTRCNANMTEDEVIERIEKYNPEPIIKYYIVIGGKEYPIKQVVAKLFGKQKMDFTSQEAYRMLKKMGYEIKERG